MVDARTRVSSARDQAFCSQPDVGPVGGESRLHVALEQRAGRGPDQPTEVPKAADVWPSEDRPAARSRLASKLRPPPSHKVRKTRLCFGLRFCRRRNNWLSSQHEPDLVVPGLSTAHRQLRWRPLSSAMSHPPVKKVRATASAYQLGPNTAPPQLAMTGPSASTSSVNGRVLMTSLCQSIRSLYRFDTRLPTLLLRFWHLEEPWTSSTWQGQPSCSSPFSAW